MLYQKYWHVAHVRALYCQRGAYTAFLGPQGPGQYELKSTLQGPARWVVGSLGLGPGSGGSCKGPVVEDIGHLRATLGYVEVP